MTLQELLDLLVPSQIANALLSDPMPGYVQYIRRALEQARPVGIQAVIWRRGGREMRGEPGTSLVTVARFRASYSVIERMSRSLAGVALELDVLPIIVPLHPETLRGMTRETPYIMRLQRRGMLIYAPEAL